MENNNTTELQETKKEKVSKEQFINVWKKACEDNTMKDNQFESGGTAGEPYHSIMLFNFLSVLSENKKSESIHFDVLLRFLGKDEKTQQGMYSPEAKVIFDNYIEYQNIDLEQTEYEEMVNIFIDAQTKAIMRRKNQIVREREMDLEGILNKI